MELFKVGLFYGVCVVSVCKYVNVFVRAWSVWSDELQKDAPVCVLFVKC